MTKPVLILGGGVYQVPLIKAAQARGLPTIVASRPGPYPGCDLADVFVPVDISDDAACLALARERAIGAVVTAGADAGLPALGRISEELGLPGPGLQAARLSTDKSLMRQAFAAAGVPSARFAVFEDLPAALEFAADLGYPLMVKPPDSSGSRGVNKVSAADDFAAAWRQAKKHSRSGKVIVESFLSGREFGAQAIVHGTDVVAVFCHADTVTDPPQSTPVGHAMPFAAPASAMARIEQVVIQAVEATGLRDCIANIDLMMVGGEPHVIEIGGRMGATGIPEMINLFTGWNVYHHVLDLALGCPGQVPGRGPGVANAVALLRSETTGQVLSLEVPDEIRNHPDLVSLQWDIQAGDQVRAFRVGPDRLGLLQVRGDAAAAEALRAKVRIVVKESA